MAMAIGHAWSPQAAPKGTVQGTKPVDTFTSAKANDSVAGCQQLQFLNVQVKLITGRPGELLPGDSNDSTSMTVD